MSTNIPKGRGDDFARFDNKSTLSWLESCITSARQRREERLITLLEIVKAEIIFEIEFSNLCNAHRAEPTDENGRRKLGEI